MKVLHIISAIDPIHGGTATSVTGLAAAQRAIGTDVAIFSTYRDAPGHEMAAKLRGQGVTVDLLPGHGQLSRHPDLSRLCMERVASADIVHIHAMWEEIQHLGARACQKQHKPYVIRPAGMLDPWSYNTRSKWKKDLFMLWRVRKNLDRASAMHFVTQIERDVTAPRLKLKPPSIVEPNGVDLAEFENLPDPSVIRARFGQLGDRRYICFLGRIYSGKGLELLIPAMAKLVDREVMLLAVGPDWEGQQARFEQMAVDCGVRDRVIFTGMLKGADRVAALSGATVFCLPSQHENFGIVVVEALAAGVPVVISDQVYCHPDITQAKVGGVVPLMVDALASELDRWLADDSMRSAAAARARPFVWDRYDWNQIAKRWAGHYRELIASQRA